MERNERRRLVDLFVLSVFLLYVEILLIRWVSTEIRIFAYLKNLVLVACFLGIGLGCLIAERKQVPFVRTFPGLALAVALVALPEAFGVEVFSRITEVLGQFNEMTTWSWVSLNELGRSLLWELSALALLVIMFFLIAVLFVPGGCLMGRLFNEAPHKIAAYSSNVAGSIVGIWCFSLVSYLSLPPAVWFVLAFGCGAFLLRSRRELAVAGLSLLVAGGVFAITHQPGRSIVWSPYQKLEYVPQIHVDRGTGERVDVGFFLRVNGVWYQHVVNLDPEFLNRHLPLWPDAVDTDRLGYNLAYRLQPPLKSVLLVGAGAGNDVAAALRNGVEHVDAVEIDPAILGFGRDHHPEHPYDDPRVSVHVDDARSFLKKTDRTYDMIHFGALDSHILASSLSNIRIDDYVYTVESFREARELLSEDGVLWLVFAIERPFISSRIFAMLEEAFGRPPIVFDNQEIGTLDGAGGGVTFVIDKAGRLAERLQQSPAVREVVEAHPLPVQAGPLLGTDDWPYLYLEGKFIPNLYWVVIVSILIAVAMVVQPFVGELRRIQPFFALLGAAFLLIEVQGISKMALLFGTTWIVNSIVITGILTMVLLANLVASRVSFSSFTPLYAALFAAVMLNYLFPFDRLLGLGTLARGLVATAVMCLPIFFAGLIFIVGFAREGHSDVALASNLLGAIAGGFAESLSFVMGINNLGLVALGLYGLSLVWARRE